MFAEEAACTGGEALQVLMHDIRNPLAAIGLLAAALLESSECRERQADLLAILGEVERIAEMTARVDAVVLTGHPPPARHAVVSLAPLIASAVRRAAPRIAENQQRLIMNLPGTLGEGRLDPGLLATVLDNLLDNAMKFTPTGGVLVVSVRLIADRIILAVEDSGPGVASEDRERIFQRGARGAARPQHGETSTGLGLAIARQAVGALGGALTCSEGSLGGARFEVVLPQAR